MAGPERRSSGEPRAADGGPWAGARCSSSLPGAKVPACGEHARPEGRAYWLEAHPHPKSQDPGAQVLREAAEARRRDVALPVQLRVGVHHVEQVGHELQVHAIELERLGGSKIEVPEIVEAERVDLRRD